MATANDVQAQLVGPAEPATVTLYENRTGPNTQPPATTASLRNALFTAAKEVTIWLPRRGIGVLKANLKTYSGLDSTAGQATNAASWGVVNHLLLRAIGTKVGLTNAEMDAAISDAAVTAYVQ